METIWYFLIALMLGVYVALDGMDIGVGILHLWVARTEQERVQTQRSIGPVWDGNEVWLVVAGGALYATLPGLYATLFSGFYLALMAVLWLLTFRALSIELRHQLHDPLWGQFWDVAFSISSGMLAVLFGTALGNLVRGVSLTADREFFAAIWTDFRVSDAVGILDWYTLFIALAALLAVTFHGSLWLAYKTDGEVQRRAQRLALGLSTVLFMASVPVTLLTAWVQPQMITNFVRYPLLFGGLGVIAFGGMSGAWWGLRRGRLVLAFRCFGVFLVAMVVSAAFVVYPYALFARKPELGLTLAQAAAPDHALRMSLLWFLPGLLLATFYTYLSYRRMPPVFHVDDANEHDGHA